MWINVFGNAAVDRLISIDDAVLEQYQLLKGEGDYGRMWQEILEIVENHGPGDLVPGGSTANIARILGQLDTPIGFVGRAAQDPEGQSFVADMQNCNIATEAAEDIMQRTFQILCLITPDGERTFAAPQSVTLPLTVEHVERAMLYQAQNVLLEGYLLFEQAEAVRHAQLRAQDQGSNVFLTLANPAVIQVCWDNLAFVIERGVDLLFANEDEMAMLIKSAEEHDVQRASQLAQIIHDTPRVVTHGGKGATWFGPEGQKVFAPCEENPSPVDTTGAGDAFAAGFLYGRYKNRPTVECLEMGHVLARRVIKQIGARLENVEPSWFEKA